MVRGFHNFFVVENLSCVGDFHANLSPIILYTILNLEIINTKNYDKHIRISQSSGQNFFKNSLFGQKISPETYRVSCCRQPQH